MAKSIPPLTDDMQNIIDCSLYNDPRVSVKRHRFCVDCLERKTTGENPCPLCRTFKEVKDTGCHGYPGKYFKENLSDLHQQYIERNLKITGEKHFEVPLVDQFKIRVDRPNITGFHMTWLGSKIYVSFGSLKLLRVFDDHAPFSELPEGIKIEELRDATSMSASLSTRSIFISDCSGRCIWKIQIPQYDVERFLLKYYPTKLSVTRDDELLVIMQKFVPTLYSMDIFRLADVSLVKSIPLSDDIVYVSCVAQSPNRDIVMNYTTDPYRTVFLISILSTDGEIIRTFNPSLFETFRLFWRPISFAITDDGDIFVVDPGCGRIFLLNSQLTDCQIVSNKDYENRFPMSIVYIKENQQLLVEGGGECETCGNGLDRLETNYVFHLSPCNLGKKMIDTLTVAKPTRGPERTPKSCF